MPLLVFFGLYYLSSLLWMCLVFRFKQRYSSSPLKPASPFSTVLLLLLCVLFFCLGMIVSYILYGIHSSHLSPRAMREVSKAAHRIDNMLDHQMSLHIQALEEENQRLRDSLAIYNVLEKAHMSGRANARIGYLSAKQIRTGVYEYHLLLTRDSTIDQNKESDLPAVHLGFEATVPRGHHLFPVPLTLDPDLSETVFRFRYFHKIDGQFTVKNASVPIKSLTVFVYVGPHIVANQTFSFY